MWFVSQKVYYWYLGICQFSIMLFLLSLFINNSNLLVESFLYVKLCHLQMISSFLLTCVQLIYFVWLKLPGIVEKKMREVDTIFPFQIIWEMLSAFPNFMSFNIGLSYEAWIILSFQSFYHKDVINFTDCVSWILRQWHDFCPLFCWYDTLYLLICICSIILA